MLLRVQDLGEGRLCFIILLFFTMLGFIDTISTYCIKSKFKRHENILKIHHHYHVLYKSRELPVFKTKTKLTFSALSGSESSMITLGQCCSALLKYGLVTPSMIREGACVLLVNSWNSLSCIVK